MVRILHRNIVLYFDVFCKKAERFENQGKNLFVFFLYSAKSGCKSIFFSSKGIQDTKRMRKVMVIGPKAAKRK
jgi:hypothetical protein